MFLFSFIDKNKIYILGTTEGSLLAKLFYLNQYTHAHTDTYIHMYLLII